MGKKVGDVVDVETPAGNIRYTVLKIERSIYRTGTGEHICLTEKRSEKSGRTADNAQDQDLNQLRKVRREKLAELQARGDDPFLITKYDVTHHSQEIKDHLRNWKIRSFRSGTYHAETCDGKSVLLQHSGFRRKLQSYVARDNIGEDHYKDFKKFDIGDIVGIRGTVFKTKTGEISIHAESVQLLSKSLQVLPEKFHG